MLAVQKFLSRISGWAVALQKLTETYGIKVTEHPTFLLVILNYDQIESPKMDPIVQECRGLTLEKGTWKVVARSFTRFFNAGEALELTEKFDWSSFTAREKADGSLILLYHYHGMWRVNTRGSFAQGEIAPGVDKTWEMVFCDALVCTSVSVSPACTYVFELCSPYNKIVRRYPTPTLFLLAAFCNHTGQEETDAACDEYARTLGVSRPAVVSHSNLSELQEWLENHEDPTYEGVVCKDKTGMRLKVKNSRYVALHQLRGEGNNLYSPKHLLPFILKGEEDELLVYFNEAREACMAVKAKVDQAFNQMMTVWDSAPHGRTQKEFALHVTSGTPFYSVLFLARKENIHPKEVFLRSPELLLKLLFKAT